MILLENIGLYYEMYVFMLEGEQSMAHTTSRHIHCKLYETSAFLTFITEAPELGSLSKGILKAKEL